MITELYMERTMGEFVIQHETQSYRIKCSRNQQKPCKETAASQAWASSSYIRCMARTNKLKPGSGSE